MKKIISAIIAVCLLLPAGGAFAYSRGGRGASQGAQTHNNTQTAVNKKSAGGRQGMTDIKTEMKQLEDTVNKNKNTLAKQKLIAAGIYSKAKSRLAKLMKNSKIMSQVQLDALKSAITDLQTDNKAINDSAEELNQKYVELKDAKKKKDTELTVDLLYEIIDLQDIRVDEMQKAVDDMNRIAAM